MPTSNLSLRVITPVKVVLEKKISSITLPASTGEITILPRHIRLFSLLKEGIVSYRFESVEESLAIGGGYVETDGVQVTVLVSRAYGQDEIDTREVEEAMSDAKKVLVEARDEDKRKEAAAILRRSVIDMKLIKRRSRSRV